MSIVWNWKNLMTEWNKAILESDLRKALPPDLLQKGWLGLPGASENQLAEFEYQRNIKLPASYRSFLSFTNGWEGRLSYDIYRLWPVTNIARYSERHQDLVASYLRGIGDEYRIFSTPSGDFHVNHMKTVLEISDIGNSAFLFLNPKVVAGDGEWEALFYATWLQEPPYRFHSFWDLMQSVYQEFLDSRNTHQELNP